MAISTLSYTLMTIVDTWFMGRIGADAVGGVGLGGTGAFASSCFGIGLLRAVKVVAAQARGGGRPIDALRALGSGVWAALPLTALCGAFGLGLLHVLPCVAGDNRATAIAERYLGLRLCGTPLILLSCAIRESLYGASDSRSPMRAALLANLAHIPLNYALVFWFELGFVGAAYATLAVQLLELALLWHAQHNHGFGLRDVTRHDVIRLFIVGAPIGVEFFLGVGAFAALVILVARMGSSELAAHQIAIQITHLAFMPTVAIGEAASVLAGNAVGAREDSQVHRIASAALAIASGYACICSIAFLCFARPLFLVFTADSATIDVGTRLLCVAALFQLLDAGNIVSRSVLRGAGDIRVPVAVATIAGWLLLPSLTYWFGIRLGYGAVGGWGALTAETATIGTVLWVRLRTGGWRYAAEQARQRMTAPSTDAYLSSHALDIAVQPPPASQ